MTRFSTFNEVVNNVQCIVDPSKWTDEQYDAMCEGLAHQGLRIILQRATASAKDPKAAMEAKVKDLQAGAYTFGAGGGGPRMDAETRGLIAWMDATRGSKEKKYTQEAMRTRLITLTREQVIVAMRDNGATDEGIKAKAKDIMAAASDPDNIAQVRAALIDGPAAPFVAIEKAKEAAEAKASGAGAGLKVTLSLVK